jgi:Na+/melibiose symporter-like transporter
VAGGRTAGGAGEGGKSLKPLFYALFTINAIALAVIVFFFMWGLSDGTVSSFNGLLWLAMLAIPSALLFGGWLQWAKGHRGLALALVLLPALPAILFGLFFLMLIVFPPDWE